MHFTSLNEENERATEDEERDRERSKRTSHLKLHPDPFTGILKGHLHFPWGPPSINASIVCLHWYDCFAMLMIYRMMLGKWKLIYPHTLILPSRRLHVQPICILVLGR